MSPLAFSLCAWAPSIYLDSSQLLSQLWQIGNMSVYQKSIIQKRETRLSIWNRGNMQGTGYTGDRRAEKPNNGRWDNPKNCDSRKPVPLLNWRSTGRRSYFFFFLTEEEALGSSVGSWSQRRDAEILPKAEREEEKYPGKYSLQWSVSWDPENSSRAWGLAQAGSPMQCVHGREGAQNRVLLGVDLLSTVLGMITACCEIYQWQHLLSSRGLVGCGGWENCIVLDRHVGPMDISIYSKLSEL